MTLATVTNLTAKPGLQQIKLLATVSDPNANGLSYLQYKDIEFTESPVNDRGDSGAAVIGTERLSMVRAGIPEEVARYFWARPRFSYVAADGTTAIYYGDYYPSSPTAGITAKAIGMSALAFGLANAEIVVDDHSSDAAVASGALRIAIKTKAGASPSTDDPVFLATPSAAAALGTYDIRTIEAAFSYTIGSGSTLGATANQAFEVSLLVLDDSGTLRPAVCNPPGPSSVGPSYLPIIDESALVEASNDALGAGGDSKIVYSSVNITAPGVPCRVIAKLTWNSGLATPGTWVNPDRTELFARGMKKPGEYVRLHRSWNDNVFTTHTTNDIIPYDNTVPQENEGKQIDSAVLKLENTANWVLARFIVPVSADIDDHVIGTIYLGTRGSVDAQGVGVVWCPAGKQVELIVEALIRPGTDSPTIGLSIGQATSGTTVTVNGVAGARKFGGLSLVQFIGTELVG